jgi:hypothetical protein
MARELETGEAAILREVRRLLAGPVSPAELAARRRAIEDLRKLRAAMPPIDMTLDERLADDDGEGD